MTESIQTRCCIVGGGPAGVMAAALLARAGIEVLVLEKHGDFLRDFRGDTVHPSTMDLLGELGWLGDFLTRPHQELGSVRAYVGSEEVKLADFSHLPSRTRFLALMPQREFLDFLVEHARVFPTFSIRMDTEVLEPLERDGRVIGVRARGPDGPLEVRADLVIAADGRHSRLRDACGLRPRAIGSPMDVLWMQFPRQEGDPTDGIGWVQPGRMMILIDRRDYWQGGYLIRKGGFEALQAAGIDAFRRELAETVPFLADRVGAIRSFDDVKLLVVTIDRLPKWWEPGILFIGDAAHAMSPIGGVGINLAIQDAVAAANILGDPLLHGQHVDDQLARVQDRRELPTRATQALQAAIQNRIIRRVLDGHSAVHPGAALWLLDHVAPLQSVPARVIGLGFRPEHVQALLA
jgi:2-polyprenyl-6-methoxyphenol hydroxylase-like FAD-dependent oxidoreductase